MKLGKLFIEIGKADTANNVIDIRLNNAQIQDVLIGLSAESFDDALTFYINLMEMMMRGSKSVFLELKATSIKRVVRELEAVGLERVSDLSKKMPYIFQPSAKSIGSVVNRAWLPSNIFRIVGFNEELKDYRGTVDELDSESINFIVEKKSKGLADFVHVRSKSSYLDVISLLRGAASKLKHPLIETRIEV